MTTVVRLEAFDLETVEDHGSVVAITGTALEGSFQRVKFAGDHRSMGGLLAILADGEDVDACVEDWQVISRSGTSPFTVVAARLEDGS